MDHDQAFKNLILDYPQAALEFFAGVGGLAEAAITPIREEQLQAVLGSRYRKLDVPLLVEWPDGQRAGVLFVVEEETEPRRFSVHRLVHYCVDLADLLKTNRIVPIVVFLHAGEFSHGLQLGDDEEVYLAFHFIYCQLARLPAEHYVRSDNIVARLNLPNMYHPRAKRVEIYAHAIDGLLALETDWNKQQKYIDFIDAYADLSAGEVARYIAEYVDTSGDHNMGHMATLLEERWQQGQHEGKQQGRQEGEASLLLKLMHLRFGPVSEPVYRRVLAADADTLLCWSERLLTAATAEEVVGE